MVDTEAHACLNRDNRKEPTVACPGKKPGFNLKHRRVWTEPLQRITAAKQAGGALKASWKGQKGASTGLWRRWGATKIHPRAARRPKGSTWGPQGVLEGPRGVPKEVENGLDLGVFFARLLGAAKETHEGPKSPQNESKNVSFQRGLTM